ncbi:dephospho-CoA kinase [uncultured Megasphaera sp.]|uniref:dephospho-CoA kinase n=1 Tax=uncultured Megasphaera sp. TaxID=165188 RepID=UPI002595BE57|nr:dephospho-CoA kinase [uncultured Megasphaera sp.]
MRIIGLTGGIATGKSTVVNMLRARGAWIIDCDILAREAVAPGSSCLSDIARHFGEKALLPDGTMDRAYIGSIVFADPARKKELEGIIFPQIHKLLSERIDHFRKKDENCLIFLDMPLLYELKYTSYVDEVWLVYVDPAAQLKRLMARNQYTESEALARIHAQLPIDEKRSLAQVVIDNTGSLESTEEQVDKEWNELRNRVWSEE